MSNIIRARELLLEAQMLQVKAMRLQEEALELMYRDSASRRAAAVHVDITPEMRRQIYALARDRSLTMHDIARRVGLRNGGRVSEVLKRRKQHAPDQRVTTVSTAHHYPSLPER